MGSCKYSQFQRALSNISPTLLSKRLKELESAELITKVKARGGNGYEYFLTPSGKSLGPIIIDLGHWGMDWAKNRITDEDLDVELLMFDIQRRIDSSYFPNNDGVLKFQFDDIPTFPNWWVVVDDQNRDLCTEDPGRDVNVYFSGSIRVLLALWGGEISFAIAKKEGLKIVGDRHLINSMKHWFLLSVLAEKQSA